MNKRYSIGGKINPDKDSLGYLQGIDEALTSIQKKHNIQLKVDLDVKDKEEAVKLLSDFDEKSRNGMNDYFTFQSVALRQLKEDYIKLRTAMHDAELDGTAGTEEYQRMIEKQSNSIVRQTNAWLALGGNVNDSTKEIVEFAEAQERVLKSRSGGYQYTKENFKELFDIMKQLIPMLEKSDGLSKNFARFTIRPADLKGIEDRAKQAEKYLASVYEKYGKGPLRQETRNEVMKSLGIVKEYYDKMAELKHIKPEYSEIYRNAAQLDIPVGFTKEDAFSKGTSIIDREYDRVIDNLRDEALKKAKEAQQSLTGGYRSILDETDKGIELLVKQVDETKKKVSYLEMEQQKKILEEWGSFENMRPRFDETKTQEGAYNDKATYNAASDLYQELFGQIEEGLVTSEEAIQKMTQHLLDAVKIGAANPFHSDEATNLVDVINALRKQIEDLNEQLKKAQEEIDYWKNYSSYSHYGSYDSSNDELEEELKKLKSKLSEAEEDLEESYHRFGETLMWRRSYGDASGRDITSAQNDPEIQALQEVIDNIKGQIAELEETLKRNAEENGLSSEDLKQYGEIAEELKTLLTSLDPKQLAETFRMNEIVEKLNGIIQGIANVNTTVASGISLNTDEDPVARRRYDVLNTALNSLSAPVKTKIKTSKDYSKVTEIDRVIKELEEKLQILENNVGADASVFSEVINNYSQAERELYDRATKTLKEGEKEVVSKQVAQYGEGTSGQQYAVDQRQEEITAIKALIKEYKKQKKEAINNPEEIDVQKLTYKIQASYEDILMAILNNVPEVSSRYNYSLDAMKKTYGREVIETLPLNDRISRITDVLKWVKQLSDNKVDLGDELNKVIRDAVKNFPSLEESISSKNRMGIVGNIENIAKLLGTISSKMDNIIKAINGEQIVNEVPNIQSDFVSDRAQNLRDLYERIAKKDNGVFSGTNANKENIKNFLEQLEIYGGNDWGLEDFARINGISEKNLKILKATSDELKKQKETIKEIAETQQEVAQVQGELPYMLDSHGNPMKWYRGLYGDSDLGAFSSHRFDGGTFWTNNPMVAASYGERTFPNRVYESLQSSYNPFVVDAKGGNWHHLPFFGLDDDAKKLQDDYETVFDNLLQMGFNFKEAHQLLFEICGKWETIYPILTRKVQGKIKNLEGALKKAGVEDWSDELLQRFDEIAESGYSYDHLFEEINEKLLEHGLVNLLDAEHINVDTKTIVEEVLKHGGYDAVYFKNILDKGGGGVIKSPRFNGREPSKEAIAEFNKDFMSDIIVQLNPEHTKYLSSGPSSQYLDETFVKNLIKVLREEFDVAEQEYDAFDTDNIEEKFNLFKEELSNDDRVERFSVLKYFMELPEEVSQKIFNILTSDTLDTKQYSEPLALALAEELEELMKESTEDAFDDAYDLLRDLDTTGILDDKEKNKLVKERLKAIQERYEENDEYLGKIYIEGLANDFAEGVVSKEAIGMNLWKGYDAVDKIVNELIANVWKEFDKQQKQAELPVTPEISETQTLEENNAAIEEKKETTKEAGEVASQVIDNEIEKTAQLQTAVEGVTKAIQEETSALKEEAKVAEATATTEQETAKKTEEVKEKPKKKRGRPRKQLSEAEVQAQEETKSYVNEITKKKQALMMQRATENLLYNPNLNGQPKEEMEGLLKLLKDVEQTSGMTKEEWANIQLIVTDITNKAKSNINENKARIKQEKEKEKAAKEQLKAEKEREKLLKSEADLESGSKSKGKLTQAQALDASTMATNVETATNTLTGIKEDVDVIKNSLIKSTEDVTTSNDLANAIKGWVEASNLMVQVEANDLSNENIYRQSRSDITLDRERNALANTKTGEIFGEYVTANKDNVSGSLMQLMRKANKLLETDMHIHSHPEDYVAPSAEDLESYSRHPGNKGLIVGRKQTMLINPSAIDDETYQDIIREYKQLTATTINKDPKVYYDLLKRAKITYNDMEHMDFHDYFKDGLSELITDWFKYLGKELNFDANDLQEIMNKKNLNFELLNEDSIQSFILNILDDELFGNISQATKNNIAHHLSQNKLFSQRELDDWMMTPWQMAGFNGVSQMYTLLYQDALQKAFNEWAPDNVKYSDFVKTLNYDTPDSLTTTAINDFLGIKNQDSNYLADILDAIKNIITILKSGGVTLSPNNSGNGKEVGLNAPKSNLSEQEKMISWYDGYAEQALMNNISNSIIYDKALARFKSSVGQNDRTELDYMTQFFTQYEEYIGDRLEEADKEEKSGWKKLSKYVKNKRKEVLGGLKDEEARQQAEDDAIRRETQTNKQREALQKSQALKDHEAQLEKERLEIEASINNEMEADAKVQEAQRKKRIKDQEKADAERKKLQQASEKQASKEVQSNIQSGEKALEQRDKTNEKDRELLRKAQDDKAKQTEKDFQTEDKRIKRLQDIVDITEQLTQSPALTLNFKENELDDFYNKLKGIQTQTSLTQKDLDSVEKEFKDITVQAKQSAKEQSELNELVRKYKEILNKRNNEGEQYFTQDYLNTVSQAMMDLRAGNLTVDAGRDILSGVSNPDYIVGSQKTLKNYITKGQKLIAQNYMGTSTKKEFESLVEVMEQVSKTGGHSRTEISRLITTFQDLEAEAAKTGKTLWGQVGQRLQDMNAKFIATYMSFHDIVRYIRSAINTITELDTALTEMRKVSDESVASLKEYQKTTFDTASALGTTAVQVQQSTADWLRLGETMEEASKSAVAATTLLNVSEFDNINSATEALVSMSQAYKDLDKTEIIDVLNNIGNNYSIATDQLATALQASSAALVTQGNDLYEAAALVTAGNAIIQDASKVGTGIRTISLRIAGVKEGDDDIREELEELGEEVDDWVVSTEAKKRQVIMDYTKVASNMGKGVDILDANGNLKDTYTILLEISKIYKEIQEEDQKYGTNRAKGLVEELAGKVRSNIAASILMNPELLENVYESAKNSAGSAAEENAKYLDSIVGKTNQFKNELQELEANVVDSEMVKDIVDIGTTFLSMINQAGDELPKVIALVGSLALTIAMVNKELKLIAFDQNNASQGLQLFGKFNLSPQAIKAYKKSLNEFLNIFTWEADFGKNQDLDKFLSNRIKGMFQSGVDAGKTFATNFMYGFKNNFTGVFSNDAVREFFELSSLETDTKEVSRLFQSLDEDSQKLITDLQHQGINTFEQFTTAEKAAGVAAKMTSVAINILNSAVTMGVSLLAMFVVSKAVEKMKSLADASEEAADKFNEFNSQLKEMRNDIKEQKEFIDDTAEEYKKLSEGVDGFGNNLSLSEEEFKRYNEITEQVADMFPTLVQGWDDTGKAIVRTTDSVNALTEAYEINRQAALSNILTGNDEVNPQSVFTNYKELLNANYFEKLKAGIKRDYTTAGGMYDFDTLYANMEALSDTTYEEFKFAVYNGLRSGVSYANREWDAQSALQILGRDKKDLKDMTKEEYYAAQLEAQAYMQVYNQQLESALKGIRDLGTAYLEFNPDYDKLSKESQQMATYVVNTIDKDLADSFNNNPVDLQVWVNKTLQSVKKLDSNSLSTLLGLKSSSDSFQEARKDALTSWNKISKAIDEEMALNANNPEELQRLSDLKARLWESSDLSAMNDTARIFANSLSAIGKSQEEINYLGEYTKDFTEEQIDLWLKSTDATMNAAQAMTAYEEALKKVKSSKYSDIGSLLSQNTTLDSITLDARRKILQDQYDAELEMAKRAGAELDRTLYGNIDLNKRGVLEWNTENIEKYSDAIKSYGNSVEDYLGSISTVDAMSSEFDGVEIAFSPMLQTPNGPVYLDKDTVYTYINKLVDQMPEGWNDADLFALDAQGLEIEGQKIKGLIAAIGDDATRVGETMHYLGTDGSLAILQNQMDELESSVVSWKDIKNDLVGLAQAGKLDEKTLKEYEYFNEILKALGLNAEEAENYLADMVDAINKIAVDNAVDDLANYRTEMDKLGDAYSKFQKGEFIDANTLSALQDAFGDLDSYQAFEKAVLTGDEHLQEHFNNIVSEYAYVHNILGNLTEDEKEYYKQMLIRSGITEKTADAAVQDALAYNKALKNKVQLTIEELNTDAVKEQKLKDLVINTNNLNNVTLKEINSLITETGITGESAEMIKYYAIQKDLAKHKDLRNADDINYLLQVCELSGIASASLQSLKHLSDNKGVFENTIKDADAAMNKFRDANGKIRQNLTYGEQQELNSIVSRKETAESALAQMGKYAEQTWDEVYSGFKDKYEKYEYKPNLDYGGMVDDASSAGSDAGEAFKDALDKILAMYDAELDAGVISFQTYVDKSRAIIEQYYREGKIKAQDYYDELASLYEKQVQQYDKVISAVQKRLQDETDALEKQKETIENSYNEQIEVIQKKIDTLQDENDEIDRNMELSKAQYQLNRALNQRTKLMYSEARGFYYSADLQGISEAEDNLRKARQNKQVAEYEKQIKALQNAMESETKSIDDQIKKLNEYSEAWGKVSSKLEEAQNNLRATEILGPNWENNILNGLSLLENFTNQYVDAQQRQKDAYLEARRAEANNPVNPNGGGTVNNGGTNGTKKTDEVKKDVVDTSNIADETKYNYEFNGVGYMNPGDAYKARADYINAQGDAAYNNYLSAHGYKSNMPYAAQKPLLEGAEEARKKAKNQAAKNDIRSLFSGTDSAKAGETLVGELKPEIVVHKNGTASIVDKPTLMNMKGGEKVFNGDETEKILKSKYVPMKQFNPKKFAMLHSFANGTSSPLQNAIAAQAVGIASGIKSGLFATSSAGGQTINQTFNVSLPNITDSSKANELFREFEQLQRKATQYFN